MPGRRRDLSSDETGTDHGDSRPCLERGANGERVIERSKHMDALKQRLIRKRAHLTAGRNDQTIIRNHLAALEHEIAGTCVERLRALPKLQLDVQLVVAFPPKREALPARLASEHFFREWRSIVRVMLLRTD